MSPFGSQLYKRASNVDARTRFNYPVLVIMPFVIPLLFTETYLRFNGELDTYAEKTGNAYRSYYNQEPPSFCWGRLESTHY